MFYRRQGYDKSNVTVELILPVSFPVGGEDVEDVSVVTGLSVLRVSTTKTFMKQKNIEIISFWQFDSELKKSEKIVHRFV